MIFNFPEFRTNTNSGIIILLADIINIVKK